MRTRFNTVQVYTIAEKILTAQQYQYTRRLALGVLHGSTQTLALPGGHRAIVKIERQETHHPVFPVAQFAPLINWPHQRCLQFRQLRNLHREPVRNR